MKNPFVISVAVSIIIAIAIGADIVDWPWWTTAAPFMVLFPVAIVAGFIRAILITWSDRGNDQ